MKKILKKLLPFIMLSGFAVAYGTLFLLLSTLHSVPMALLPCQLILLPFLCYGHARLCKAGWARYYLNLMGGMLVSPLCYLMIFSGIIGVVLFAGYLFGYIVLTKNLAMILLLTALFLTLIAVVLGLLNATRIRTTHYHVKLPVKKDCKAVLFSDLHLGGLCSIRHVKRVVDKIKKESPALVLFAGDLFDMDLPSDKKCAAYAEILSGLGEVIGCEGNHDLYTRDDSKKADFLQKANIRIGPDEMFIHTSTGLRIYTRKSGRRERADIPSDVDILLDHEPKTAEEAVCRNIPLILCGHTHRGQTFPGNILRKLSTPYFYGMKHTNQSTVITTAGCGSTGLPLRFGITGEIVVLHIESNKEPL